MARNNDDFPSMFNSFFTSINYKTAMYLFIILVIVLSDTFVSYLSKIKNAVDGDCPNSKGALIQIVLIVILYIIVDLLVRGDYI